MQSSLQPVVPRLRSCREQCRAHIYEMLQQQPCSSYPLPTDRAGG
jgi:hypothetical protein